MLYDIKNNCPNIRTIRIFLLILQHRNMNLLNCRASSIKSVDV